MKRFILSLIIIIVLLLTYFILHQNMKLEENGRKRKDLYINEEIKRIDKVKNSLIGKKVSSIKKIVKSYSPEKQNIVFFFTGFDCSTCIENGFSLINELEKRNINFYIIFYNANIARYTAKEELLEILYEDKDDLLRKEIKYASTPLIVIFDDNYSIKALHIPLAYEKIDNKNREIFLNLLTAKTIRQ